MRDFALRRLAAAPPVVLAVSFAVFMAMYWLPGDGIRGGRLPATATDAQVAAERARLGLDRPVLERYARWLADALHGDLGHSWTSGRPVTAMLGGALGNTAWLMAATLAVTVPLALGLALWCGLRPGGLVDRAVLAVCALGVAVPGFVVGIGVSLVFAVRLGWFPALSSPDRARPLPAQPALLALPVTVLALGLAGYLVQVVRAQVVTVAAAEYVEAARLRGVRPARLVRRHLLPGLLPVAAQLVALSAIGLVTETVVVENVFTFPGAGSLLRTATADRDMPVVQGIAVVLALVVVVANVLGELCARLLDPAGRGRAAG
ncbi:peptide/nickel transport system permease protein [Actinomadura madurae]|uniref:Peptide/nickel transport system permease protein n=1 Tax=Actinomadura madurae TaxID=1993 RepID=A0A1I5PC74_9ACTN|nr:ABC transporter permease [Actinomadura madurae]SFP31121.1 peptide/nickel transport system permease protein [Actinomadura madurae]